MQRSATVTERIRTAVCWPGQDPSYEHLSAEHERALRREHFKAHPDGLTPVSRKPCTICLLLGQLFYERRMGYGEGRPHA